MPNLFERLKLGALTLPNRVLMAPLTRGRSTREGVPTSIRLVQPAYNDGKPPVSSSATKAEGHVPTYEGEKPYAEARPLRVDEMPRRCADYANAARNAIAAAPQEEPITPERIPA